MSPFLYDPTPYLSLVISPYDTMYAGIGCFFVLVALYLFPKLLEKRELARQEQVKQHKKQILKSLIVMKGLEDELEKEMRESLIARAVRNLPTQ